MPHSRRYIVSNNCYAVTFRAREGLPLPATQTIEHILQGCMARTQRDDKVVLSHFLWMANHVHLILVAKDPSQLVKFYAELQKKITDSVRSLLGRKRLTLWEGRPVVAFLADLDIAITQIVYLYANPSRADLERSIEKYPGFSSWGMFSACSNSLHSTLEYNVKWTRASNISALPLPVMPAKLDFKFRRDLEDAGIKEVFKLNPNAWMSAFGISSEEQVAEVNQTIRERLRLRELEYELERKAKGRGVIGAEALRLQSILKSHQPKECERRVYIIASDKQTRINFINEFKDLSQRCYECFCEWVKGKFVPWPPGFFIGPIRPLASAIEF